MFAATGAIVFGTTGIGWVGLKLLLLAVLSSSAASCQTTILPAARTALSMAMHRAAPAEVRRGRPRAPDAGVLVVAVRHHLVRVVRGATLITRY